MFVVVIQWKESLKSKQGIKLQHAGSPCWIESVKFSLFWSSEGANDSIKFLTIQFFIKSGDHGTYCGVKLAGSEFTFYRRILLFWWKVICLQNSYLRSQEKLYYAATLQTGVLKQVEPLRTSSSYNQSQILSTQQQRFPLSEQFVKLLQSDKFLDCL